MIPQIQAFSSSYYMLAPMYVEPHEVENPSISERLYNFLQENVYEGFRRVIVKVETRVFEVQPSRGISPEVIAAPDGFVEDELGVEFPPRECVAFVAREDFARELHEAQITRDFWAHHAWEG